MSDTVLSNRYELIQVIGRGGMAEVWRALDRQLGREVAVKVLHAPMAADPRGLARFQREATASAAIDHPGMVSIYDAGADDDRHFLVMELLQGETLAALMGREGRLDPVRVAEIGAAVAVALGAVHRVGLVHRDVKPPNIMLTKDRGVKLMDLGIVSGPAENALTAAASVIGTAAYLSPEQAQGKPATPQSDIYGLGCVLFHATTGRPPFDGDTPVAMAMQHVHAAPPVPSEVARTVPGWFDAVVARALAKDPDERFADAAAMAQALRDHREPAARPGGAVQAPPPPTPSVVESPSQVQERPIDPETSGRRRSAALVGIGVALLLAVVLAAGLWWVSTQDSDPIGTVPPGEPDTEDPPPEGEDPGPDPQDPPPEPTEPPETTTPTTTEPTDDAPPEDSPPEPNDTDPPADEASRLDAFLGRTV